MCAFHVYWYIYNPIDVTCRQGSPMFPTPLAIYINITINYLFQVARIYMYTSCSMYILTYTSQCMNSYFVSIRFPFR